MELNLTEDKSLNCGKVDQKIILHCCKPAFESRFDENWDLSRMLGLVKIYI